MRIPTLRLLVRRSGRRATAALQIAGLLIALVAAACVSGTASSDTTDAARLVAARSTMMSAALLPESGAWMITTLGLVGIEWMARRKRVV